MAKACGLRIGPRRFELVVIDGSPKKHKVVNTLAGEIPPDEDDPIGAAAFALKSAIQAHRISMDNVGLVIESRAAAFRSVSLPVVGEAKIEEVLKFEVESQLPQFNIDDVVVDFYVKDETAHNSDLLVTAAPKQDIQDALELCQQAGFEPIEAELETSALINSVSNSDLCGSDEAIVLVHIGEESTAVSILDGGRVREMRIIQTGALSYTPHGVVPSDEEGEHKESTGPQKIERADEVVARLRRELARTVSAARTINELTGLHVCGFVLPGILEGDVLGLPIMPYDNCAILESEGDVHEEYNSAAVAYGAALRQLGGGYMPARLRREELKFSGALERIELPLAVMFLLITTFLGVWFMFQQKERTAIDKNLYFLLTSSSNYMLGNPKKGQAGNLEYPSDSISNYVKDTIVNGDGPEGYREDPNRDRYEQLRWLKVLLNQDQVALQKRLGNDMEVLQPQSALKGLTMVLDQMAKADKRYGRVSMRHVTSDFRSSARDGDYVEVTLRLSFFADTLIKATENYEMFSTDLSAQPWHVSNAPGGAEPISGKETGSYLSNYKILVDLTKIEEVKS
jgi:Tfp pilus assembly PilM family ATPase